MPTKAQQKKADKKRKKIIGGSIYQSREAKKIELEDFAKTMGTTIMTVLNWENGVYFPSSRFINKIAETLEIEAADLLR